MWLLTCNNKIPPTTKNLTIALPNSINAFVPKMRCKPLKGLSLLNLGATMPKENTMPPDKTVETMAMKYIINMMGKISKKASTMACANKPGNSSALSVILRSNSNWDTNNWLMPLNSHPPMRLKNPTAPKDIAATGNSMERANCPSERAFSSRLPVGSSVFSALSSAMCHPKNKLRICA